MFRSHTKIFGIFTITTIVASLVSVSAFAEEENTTFNVNVKESLTVSVTTPSTWASGNIDEFLRNKVNVTVSTNNAAGFTASMTTQTANTSLINTTKNIYTLPTLASSTTRGNFPANYWGYSLDDVDAGSSSSTYSALVGAGSTPIIILSSNSAASGSKDFYFGAKGNAALAAGTYTGTVVINVVTGVIDNNTNPVTPTNPAGPSSTDNTAEYAAAPTGSSGGATSYTYRRSSGSGSSATSTVTTEVSEGNNVSAYVGYTPPQGETYSSSSNLANGAILASGLAATASMAAASGIFLFIASKKRDEEEDEDEDQLSQM